MQDTGVWRSVAGGVASGSVPSIFIKDHSSLFLDSSSLPRAFLGHNVAQIAPGEPSLWEKRAKQRGGKGWGTGPFFLECVTNCLSALGWRLDSFNHSRVGLLSNP